jgi:hypothetical protein
MYACSGSAPVTTAYGPDAKGYHVEYPTLPWSASTSSTAQYIWGFGLSAYLQDPGSVSCSVSLEYSSAYTGYQLVTVTSTVNSNGTSYSFPEICSDPAHPGHWTDCGVTNVPGP